jgi:hypothetical protein
MWTQLNLQHLISDGRSAIFPLKNSALRWILCTEFWNFVMLSLDFNLLGPLWLAWLWRCRCQYETCIVHTAKTGRITEYHNANYNRCLNKCLAGVNVLWHYYVLLTYYYIMCVWPLLSIPIYVEFLSIFLAGHVN